MLKLYHTPISFNSRRVWIALIEKGLDFELIPVKLDGDQFKAEFLALNPFHHIPVLVDGEFTIVESFAILDYIEAQYPIPSLLPVNPQLLGTVKMIEMITLTELLPAMTPLIQNKMGFIEVDEKKSGECQQKIKIVLTFFEKLLGNRAYFGGENLSLAELVAGTVIPLLPDFDVFLHDYPQLENWSKRLTERDSWKQTQVTPEEIEAFKTTMKKLMASRKS